MVDVARSGALRIELRKGGSSHEKQPLKPAYEGKKFHQIGDSYKQVYRKTSTCPPDRFNLTDLEVGVEGDEPRTAIQTNESIVLPPGWRFRLLLYWLAAFFLVAGVVPGPSQSDSQLGSKLVGTGAVGPAEQGWSVALSADGNNAIVGGVVDNRLTGAAWIFTRNGDIWAQQGSKLVGTGTVGQGGQGFSVALSADGTTAIVGGPYDSSNIGAAWIYSRNGTVWTQQGNKLVGTGAVGSAAQGVSVALSADGTTAIVGGSHDNSSTGAAWIYSRSGEVWTQQGNKLVGTGAVGIAYGGSSVALSGDGNTAVVGGPYDNSSTGAAWVYTRNGGVWTQQGSKLVGAGAVGQAGQGFSVALSADGNAVTVVYFEQPVGVQSAALAKICPAVTVECGRAGDEAGVTHVAELITSTLALARFPDHPVPDGDLDLMRIFAIVKVPPGADFSYDGADADFRLRSDLDRLNFSELDPGTLSGLSATVAIDVST
jgi:antibiotic biosynthesis monooxygenase (ABM) superfamily enzyme